MEIIITEYNPNWRIFFKNEKILLKEIFSNQYKSINHIGSTSISGLASKPIVDISIGVEKLKEKDFYLKILNTIGYQYNTGSEFEDWILFRKRTLRQAFNLHIMPYNSKRLLDQLIFKHCLLDNKKLIEDYGWLKKYYIKYDDNLFYHMNKLPFVTRVVEGFKEGLSQSLKCSEKELYQYVQNNFIEK
ncbi:MAG: GrpB family protein [candidate division Zixibacteria bacterium]|nr:GrpB family protein [candidate division Zixibacteria bacterium]